VTTSNTNTQQPEYCVYKHVCPDNTVYVGQCKGSPSIRWENGRGYSSQRFAEAIRKFKWNNIKHYLYHPNGWIQVHDDKPVSQWYALTQEQADFIENSMIIALDATNPLKGWNVRKGSQNIEGISETPDYDESRVRTKLTLSMPKCEVTRLKIYSTVKNIPISKLVIDMFNELHGDENLEV
jgi:hypothetical protein